MWKIAAIFILSAQFITAHPELAKNDGTAYGDYQGESFSTQADCEKFLANPDEPFKAAQESLNGKAKPGVSFKYVCREVK